MSEKKSVLQFEVTKKKVPRKDIMHFSRQMAVFVRAGVPIMEALEVIAGETSDKLLNSALHDMIERLQAGDTFASAAGAHPEAFPTYYIGILASAELTGNLDVVLDQLADYLDRDIEARGKITSAMIYPSVVAVMAVVVVIVLATFVMPKFVVFFASFNAQLPLPTRMLLSASNFVSTYWWAILGVILVAVVGIAVLRRSEGRQGADGLHGPAAPDPRRPGAHRGHRARVPDPLVHAQGGSLPSRRHARHRRVGEQCCLQPRPRHGP